MNSPFYIRSDPQADLLVTGEDAAEFLQGQFTNDLRPAGGKAITYGLWLNQKGRVLADSFIWQETDNAFRVTSEWSAAAVIRERLETYIIADDVAIDDCTGQWAGWVLGGAEVTGWVEQLGFTPPPLHAIARTGEALLFRSRVGGRSSWRLQIPRAEAPAWENKLGQIAGEDCRVETARVHAHRIADGVPSVPEELGAADLPHEGGLEHEAISYAKGCYLGQEVMSRLKNLGRVRRRLHVVRGSAETTIPSVGSDLLSGARPVGALRSVQPDVRGWIGLAMLQIDNAAAGQRLRSKGSEAESIAIDGVAEGRAW